MVVTEMIGSIKNYSCDKTVVHIPLEWFELDRKRMKKTASDGTEIGFAVEEGIRDGDIAAETESKLYVVNVLPVKLIEVRVQSLTEMGRVCFELGNRHLSLQINEGIVRVVYEEPVFLYLKKLGFDVGVVNDKFTGYIVCKGHGHHEQ